MIRFIPLFNRRAASNEAARVEAESRESEAIRAAILRRADRLVQAEANRPEVSRQLEGAIVEVWL